MRRSMTTHKTTYDLVVQSEDKNRTVVETLIYALFILSGVLSIVQFATQPVIVPAHISIKEVKCQTQYCA